jgi:hypothetical protein
MNPSHKYKEEMELEKHHALTIFEEMLIQLHQVSTGIAIPMCSGIDNKDNLSYALVGHRGNSQTNSSSVKKKKETARGSKIRRRRRPQQQ